MEKGLIEDAFSQAHFSNFNNQEFPLVNHHHSYHQNHQEEEEEFFNGNSNQIQTHLLQEMNVQEHDHSSSNNNNNNNMLSNWEEMNLCYHQQQQVQVQETPHHHHHHNNPFPFLPTSSLPYPSPPPTNQKSSSFFTSLGFLGDLLTGPSSTSVVYDPLLPLNLPQQPPLLTDLIQSFPNGYNNFAVSQDGDEEKNYENGVFEFKDDGKCKGKGRKRKGRKPFVNEKQRRVQVKGKYQDLRSLVPNPTKDDRASIVKDAIEYINELKRTVAELKIVVEKKRCIRDSLKRQQKEGNPAIFKAEDDVDEKPLYGGSSLRTSWLQRKSNHTEVDVRITDDEVTVKVVQQKRINSLLFVAEVLDQLLLDIHHAAGGLIGDSYSYIFNCKICEDSNVYASAIANKLIEVIDRQHASVQQF